MKIEKRIYSGYVWMSDEPTPIVIENKEYELEIADDKNPFVIEAQLYSADKISVSIKYVDGRYIQRVYSDVSRESINDTITLKEYVANPKIGDKTLLFLQYWEDKEDDKEYPTRCGMKELRPGKLVFVGFKEKEDKR